MQENIFEDNDMCYNNIKIFIFQILFKLIPFLATFLTFIHALIFILCIRELSLEFEDGNVCPANFSAYLVLLFLLAYPNLFNINLHPDFF